jgi:glycosyltransferase involved in cell wall biosynthesis
VDDSEYYPVKADPKLAEEFNMAGRFNIVFAGNIGLVQGLYVIIAAAELLQDLEAVQFVLVGDGEERKQLEHLVRERGLRNVLFIDRQGRESINAIYAIADVLFVHLKKDEVFEIIIPSKTIAYLASGRPILMGVAGEAAELVESIKAGLTCEPGNHVDLAEKVKTLYRMPHSEREKMGMAGRKAFLENFRKDIILSKFNKLFQYVSSMQEGR